MLAVTPVRRREALGSGRCIDMLNGICGRAELHRAFRIETESDGGAWREATGQRGEVGRCAVGVPGTGVGRLKRHCAGASAPAGLVLPGFDFGMLGRSVRNDGPLARRFSRCVRVACLDWRRTARTSCIWGCPE